MTIFINPYKRGSKGAKNLKNDLVGRGIKTIMTERAPRFATPLIVFWGNSDPVYPLDRYQRIVNHPAHLPYMTNKLRFFNHVGHDPWVPEWTTDAQEASNWNAKVLCRHKLEASGGAGIEVWEPSQNRPIPLAPLYVRYEKKTHEFRLHMARGLRGHVFEPILVQRKVFQKREGVEQPKSWEVRNHDNGFVFVQQSDFPAPASVLNAGKTFMEEVFPDLHFCALDVIYHQPTQREFILEGNTAPGLEGNTVKVYADYLTRLHVENQWG